MNIFILDNDVRQSAKYHCDQHVNKMILEAAQMVCAVQYLYGHSNIPYKLTHPKHPCTLWAGKSLGNYIYLLDYMFWLNEEAKTRYKKKTNHKSFDAVQNLEFPDFDVIEQTPFARAMPDEFKSITDTVEAYRQYYKTKTFATWNHSSKPEWY